MVWCMGTYVQERDRDGTRMGREVGGNRGRRHLLGDGQTHWLLQCTRPSVMNDGENRQFYMVECSAGVVGVKLRRYMYLWELSVFSRQLSVFGSRLPETRTRAGALAEECRPRGLENLL